MKKLTIAAVATSLALCSITMAQDTSSASIYSGPWELRKSTGDKVEDRVLFVADRTLNACERQTLREMFLNSPGSTEYVVTRAIAGAIDSGVKSYPTYSTWWSGNWQNDNGMSDINVYNAMSGCLNSSDRVVLGAWLSSATDSQLSTVAKLVRLGGYANSVWLSSGMDNK